MVTLPIKTNLESNCGLVSTAKKARVDKHLIPQSSKPGDNERDSIRIVQRPETFSKVISAKEVSYVLVENVVSQTLNMTGLSDCSHRVFIPEAGPWLIPMGLGLLFPLPWPPPGRKENNPCPRKLEI